MRRTLFLILACASLLSAHAMQDVLNLWPGKPPGETKELPPEADQTKPEDKLIAGRRIIKLGNVSTPTLTFYPAPKAQNTGASVIICPGGGHHILAWDLEGTEVAQWLNSLGVNAFVLKYRVPARNPDKRWEAAVQDAQRAMSLVRSKASTLGIQPDKIGILGFSAGGETAALTSILPDRQYTKVDSSDETPWKPNFAILIYTGGIVERDNATLRPHIKVTADTPPMFLAHAYDDGVHVAHSALLFLELKKANVPAELHAYSVGGHGYGLRKTDEPVTTWHDRCAEWLKISGWLKK